MDRLVLEPEVETEQETEIETKQEEKVLTESQTESEEVVEETQQEDVSVPQQDARASYVDTFSGITLADIKKQKEDEELKKFQVEKDELRKQQFSEPAKENESEKIIEKPNYDLIEEGKAKYKVSVNKKQKAQKKSKAAGVALACVLGATAVVSIANSLIIDNMSSNYMQIEETYQLNLYKYLKNITKLDTTKQGMQFLETYPEDGENAGEVGKQTNWFDSLCNWLGGVFGG